MNKKLLAAIYTGCLIMGAMFLIYALITLEIFGIVIIGLAGIYVVVVFSMIIWTAIYNDIKDKKWSDTPPKVVKNDRFGR